MKITIYLVFISFCQPFDSSIEPSFYSHPVSFSYLNVSRVNRENSGYKTISFFSLFFFFFYFLGPQGSDV